MQAFIRDQAQRVADAMTNQRRVETIERQVQNILEDIANGNRPKITSINTDQDLYDELVALGIVKPLDRVRDDRRGSRPPAKPRLSFTVPRSSLNRVESDRGLESLATAELNKMMADNNVRLRELTLLIEDEDNDEEGRKKLEADNAKLVATQRKIWWIIDTRNKQTVDAGKLKTPPPQTPLYNEAKRKKRVEFTESALAEPDAKRRYKQRLSDDEKEDGEIEGANASGNEDDEIGDGDLYADVD
jgi:hypothetical protein